LLGPASAGVALLDPAELLWEPGKQVFFDLGRRIITPPTVQSNTLLTISMITREALRVLENNLTFTKHINRHYDDQFKQVGSVVQVNLPRRYADAVRFNEAVRSVRA